MPFNLPLITFTPSTTGASADVNSNFNALNSGNFSTLISDDGLIASDGNGNLLFRGYLGVIANDDVLDAAEFGINSGIFIKTRTAGTINFQTPNGTTQMYIDKNGLHGMTGNTVLNLYQGSIGRVSEFTGAGDGTVQHGLSIAPNWVGPTCTAAGRWDVYGYTTALATTVYVVSLNNLAYLAQATR